MRTVTECLGVWTWRLDFSSAVTSLNVYQRDVESSLAAFSKITFYNHIMQHIPTNIQLRQRSKLLEIAFVSGESFVFPCEYLRVYSPSAEVRGHGGGQDVLQIGKEQVNIIAIEPVGQYAVKLVFDDGHDSGLYSWDWLFELGCEQHKKWRSYLARLHSEEGGGYQREPQENDKYCEPVL